MAEWSKAPDSSSGLGRGFKSHFGHDFFVLSFFVLVNDDIRVLLVTSCQFKSFRICYIFINYRLIVYIFGVILV
jgi:hypothetical protein